MVQSRCDVLENELWKIFFTGNFYPNNLGSGNMERFFFTLAILMTINTLVFWRISQRYGSSFEWDIIMKHLSVYRTDSWIFIMVLGRYTDLSVELSSGLGHSRLSEKLLQYKACLRYYDTVERSDTLTSMETVLWIHCKYKPCNAGITQETDFELFSFIGTRAIAVNNAI